MCIRDRQNSVHLRTVTIVFIVTIKRKQYKKNTKTNSNLSIKKKNSPTCHQSQRIKGVPLHKNNSPLNESKLNPSFSISFADEKTEEYNTVEIRLIQQTMGSHCSVLKR